MPKKGPVKLSSIITSVLEKAGGQDVYEEAFIKQNWEKIVGKQMSEVVTVQKIQQNILFIHAMDPAWKMHLHLQKTELLAKIQGFMNNKSIKEIRIQ